MTALNTWITPTRIVVVTDTLAKITGTDHPFGFVAKVHSLPHLDMMVAGTGSGDLTDWWRDHLERATGARDLDEACVEAERLLPALWVESGSSPSTVYQFGWSPAANRIVGVGFSYQNGFSAVAMADGFMIKPMVEDWGPIEARSPFTSERDLVLTLVQQAAEDRARAPEPDGYAEIMEDGRFIGRCGIGGDCMIHELAIADGRIVSRSWRELQLDHAEADAAAASALGHLGDFMLAQRAAEREARRREGRAP